MSDQNPKKIAQEKDSFQKLLNLASALRSDQGCPWDRKQTIASMLKYIEEEAHELCTAIENGDHENLKEELGDVLFQVIMVAQIASEQNYFSMDDVIKGISDKIISRHTWVFGDDKAETPEEALVLWKKNKEKEKNKNT